MKDDTRTDIEIDAMYMTVDGFVEKHGYDKAAFYWDYNSSNGRCSTPHYCTEIRDEKYKARKMKFAKWANLTAN